MIERLTFDIICSDAEPIEGTRGGDPMSAKTLSSFPLGVGGAVEAAFSTR
jgi:hypothetical protein